MTIERCDGRGKDREPGRSRGISDVSSMLGRDALSTVFRPAIHRPDSNPSNELRLGIDGRGCRPGIDHNVPGWKTVQPALAAIGPATEAWAGIEVCKRPCPPIVPAA